MKNTTDTTTTETATVEAPVKVNKAKAHREALAAEAKKPLYNNTVKITGRGATKSISGRGTIADLAKLLNQDVPPVHGFVKVAELTGMATVQTHVRAEKPKRGRTATVYSFNVKAPAAPKKKAKKS